MVVGCFNNEKIAEGWVESSLVGELLLKNPRVSHRSLRVFFNQSTVRNQSLDKAIDP